MKKSRIILVLSIISVFLIYAFCWFYYMNKAVSYVNNNYANKQIFLPKQIFDTSIWKEISNRASSDKNTTSNKFLFNNIWKYFIDNVENYNVSFSNAKYSNFPFSFEISLENFIENNVESELKYNEPLKVGYNFLKQELYVYFNGAITANFHPKVNGIVKDINLVSKITIPISLKNLYSGSVFTIIRDANNIKFDTKDITIKDANTGEIFFKASNIKRDFKLAHYFDYKSWDDVINFAPRQFSMDAKYNIEKVELFEVEPIFSVMNLSTYEYFTGNYESKYSYKTGALDWKDLKKVLNNSEFSYEGMFDSATQDKSVVSLDFSLLNPEDEQYKAKLLFDSYSQHESKEMFHLIVNKIIKANKKVVNPEHSETLNQVAMLLNAFIDMIPEKYEDKINIEAFVDISKDDINVDVKKLQLQTNDTGFDFSNKTTISKTKLSSDGKIALNDIDTISKLMSDLLSLKFELNGKEKDCIQKALMKTINIVSGSSEDNKKNIKTTYKINILSQEVGNYSIARIVEMLKNNLSNIAKDNMSESDAQSFLKKFGF